ncbi:MAG TPA: carboxypeptidase regulatory-like domain-containing protein [Bryobacteraceae bacterium]|nr:carboxypeptidase regulatory-like domain-containing protein [Bryobacteraceae bacterium]
MNPRSLLSCLLIWVGFTVYAQAPTGIILGTVTDQTGAVVPNAKVTITNKATGAARVLAANTEGIYSAPALLPGEYEVRAEVQGFRTLVRDATVEAGSSTTVNLAMSLGTSTEVVNVEAATAQINYDSHSIQGVIEHSEIQELPLNGRSFVQLATLEPGVTASYGSTSQFNTLFSVSVLGMGKVRYTIDGGVVNDEVDGGGNMISINFSQENVQEFQMSSVNFDLSSGVASSGGTINVVTRSGSNDFHGSGYFYFRDHNMAAYPALRRQALDPNPFFVRRNPGVAVGGPILKDKLFFFSSWERMNQTQVNIVQEDLPSLQPINQIVPLPYAQPNLFSARFDYRLSTKHSLFARYTHDGNNGIGNPIGNSPLSSFDINKNWSDQSVLGVTSTLTPSIVNDFRFMWHYWQNNNLTEPADACQLPCVGGGLPSLIVMVGSSTFQAGLNINAPQNHVSRSFEEGDTLSWQKGAHRLRFGFDLERMNTLYNPWDFCVQGCLYLWSPETVRALVPNAATLFPNLPTQIRTNADLLQIPVYNANASTYSGVSIGDGTWPGGYHHNQGRRNTRSWEYVTDTWKFRPNLTFNFGIGYQYETGLFDSDIPYPQYLAPIFGANDLGATQPNKFDISPAFGFAWSPTKSNKTVIRGGAGLYWDTQPIYQRFREDAAIGPLGDGRSTVAASVLTNEFPGMVNAFTNQSIPVGAPLPLNTLSTITLGNFVQMYNHQIDAITQRLSPKPPASGPYTVTGIDVAKQGSEIYLPGYPVMRSYQTSIGVQRDLGHDMVLTADWARRQYENVQMSEVDLNRFNRRINGVLSPVIPACTAAQVYVPGQECSTGGISFWMPEGRVVFDALLMKLQKRYAKRSQFTVSYALQKELSTGSAAVNPSNYFTTYGPVLPRHNLTVAGLVDFPWGFKLSVNNSIVSRSPVNATIPQIDIFGVGAVGMPLSEAVSSVGYNCFAANCGKSDLAKGVATFNSTYAGKKDASGANIPTLVLPPDYQFGDPTFNTDARVTKELRFREKYSLQVFGEFFNAFNIARLTNYTFNLDTLNPKCTLSNGAFASCPAGVTQSYAYGQPTQRFNQIFGSGGPRAIQVGARFSF